VSKRSRPFLPRFQPRPPRRAFAHSLDGCKPNNLIPELVLSVKTLKKRQTAVSIGRVEPNAVIPNEEPLLVLTDVDLGRFRRCAEFDGVPNEIVQQNSDQLGSASATMPPGRDNVVVRSFPSRASSRPHAPTVRCRSGGGRSPSGNPGKVEQRADDSSIRWTRFAHDRCSLVLCHPAVRRSPRAEIC